MRLNAFSQNSILRTNEIYTTDGLALKIGIDGQLSHPCENTTSAIKPVAAAQVAAYRS